MPVSVELLEQVYRQLFGMGPPPKEREMTPSSSEIEDAYALLGLEPPAAFYDKQLAAWQRHPEYKKRTQRQVGRTTKMCVEAAVAAAQGETVVVVGHSPHYGLSLVRKVREYARRLGCPDDVERVLPDHAPEYMRKGARIFVDHYSGT